jgi:hypothetical protein
VTNRSGQENQSSPGINGTFGGSSLAVSLAFVVTEVFKAFIEAPARDKLTSANRTDFHVAAEVMEAAVEHTAVVAAAAEATYDIFSCVVRDGIVSHRVIDHGDQPGPERRAARAGLGAGHFELADPTDGHR